MLFAAFVACCSGLTTMPILIAHAAPASMRTYYPNEFHAEYVQDISTPQYFHHCAGAQAGPKWASICRDAPSHTSLHNCSRRYQQPKFWPYVLSLFLLLAFLLAYCSVRFSHVHGACGSSLPSLLHVICTRQGHCPQASQSESGGGVFVVGLLLLLQLFLLLLRLLLVLSLLLLMLLLMLLRLLFCCCCCVLVKPSASKHNPNGQV